MRIIQSVAPDLSVCLTNDNRLVIMVETDDGEHLAEITDMDRLSGPTSSRASTRAGWSTKTSERCHVKA